MSELVINQFRFKKETGFGIFEDFLFPKLQLASWKMHGHFAIESRGYYLSGWSFPRKRLSSRPGYAYQFSNCLCSSLFPF